MDQNSYSAYNNTPNYSNTYNGNEQKDNYPAYVPDGLAVKFESCTVHDPEIRGSNRLNQFHVYKITTTPVVVDHVYRRYSDFVWLADTLASLYPGIFIPPLPPKKTFGSLSSEFVHNERRPALERFLIRVMNIPILVDSAPFQMFLTRANSFEDGQKELKRMVATRSIPSIISAYKHYYPDIISLELTPNINQQVAMFDAFLKATEIKLTDILSHVTNLVEYNSKCVSSINKMTTSFQDLSNIEKSYTQYPGQYKLPVGEHFTQWHIDSKEVEPSYSFSLKQHFTYELADIKSLIKLVAVRENQRSKYEKAQSRASKWGDPTTKCETDKQRAQRDADFKSEDEENALLDIITKIIMLHEIKLVYANVENEFTHHMIEFGKAQALYAQCAYQNWDGLANKQPVAQVTNEQPVSLYDQQPQ